VKIFGIKSILVFALVGVAVGIWQYQIPEPLPSIPEIPTEWLDPPLIDLIKTRREAVVANEKNAKAWGQLGQAFQAHGRNEEADNCYRAASQLNPTEIRWWYLRGVIQTTLDPKFAISLFRKAMDCEGTSIEKLDVIRLRLADQLLEQKQDSEAEKLYLEVTSHDARNPWSIFRLSALAVERGQDADAIKPLMTLARNPYFQKKGAALLAGIYRRRGNQKEADGFEFAASQLPTDLDPSDPFMDEVRKQVRGQAALIKLAARYEESSDYRSAIEISDRIYREYPSATSLLLVGKNLVNDRQDEKAVRVLEEVIKQDNSLVIAHAFLGVANFHLAETFEKQQLRSQAEEKYRLAIQSLDRAVELKSDYAPGYFYRAQAMSRLGEKEKAASFAQQFLDRRPEYIEGYLTLSEILMDLGRKEDAIRALQNAQRVAHPSDPRPKQSLDAIQKKN
jgi:tetratricopeptide (TPR) repeat protein